MPDIGLLELFLLALAVTVAVVILWPRRAKGQRLLRRWGIEEPTPEQGEVAAAYLRTRRWRYVPIFVVLSLVVGAVRRAADVPGETSEILLLLVTIVTSLLIGEVSAMLRPARRGQHSAALLRRGVTDLVPAYGVLAFSTVTVTTLFLVVINLFLPGVREPRYVVGTGAMWLLLAALAAVVASCGAVVWLSLIRGRLDDDGAVDAALRIRTARVTVGTGLLLLVWIAGAASTRIDNLAHLGEEPSAFVAFADTVGYPAGTFVSVMGIFAWMMLISPIRKQRLVEAYR
jgi:hypothetical protein